MTDHVHPNIKVSIEGWLLTPGTGTNDLGWSLWMMVERTPTWEDDPRIFW